MKNYLLLICFITANLSFAQKQFTIQWNGSKTLETAYGKSEIPAFETKHFSYTEEQGLRYFTQWDNTNYIDNASVTISNISYQDISNSDLKDLDIKTIPQTPQLKFYNTNARDKQSSYLELSPIINVNGVYKKITAFTVNYNTTQRPTASKSNFSTVTNSVLNTGEWYKFYVERSGLYKLSKGFLNSLGINTNSVNPRTIKIYGYGGRMLPLENLTNNIDTLEENAVKFVGEADGSFDSNDYIAFYAEGPDRYSEESLTNVNLYTDKTYYYVNVSSGNGKRIQEMPDITATANIDINTFQDYQYYEVDENNLAKLGRLWYGDEFDVENQRTYTFNFPNLVTTLPLDYEYSIGSVSENTSTMTVSINDNVVDNLALPPVNFSSILASSITSGSSILSTSDEVTVTLNYDNGGNPTANAYLDYINITATRGLTYEGEQLIIQNNIVDTSSGIAQYNLSNASSVNEVWDITDRHNITYTTNASNDNIFSFKANAGIAKTYLAFSDTNFQQPSRDAITRVENQNLKGTIFNNAQGQFTDIDYIIVTPKNLATQAERLAEINRTKYGLNVKVVDLQSIYNEFNTGNKDIAAIRNFIRYVYDNASTPQNRLKYLCLFGDSSYDYKDRVRNNNNIVPTWYSINSFSLTNSFLSDDFYTMMDVGEGQLGNGDRMDLAVGRMLANDIQQAKELVDKVDAYYQKEAFGSWRNNFIVISDDVDVSWERLIQETTDEIGVAVETEKPFMNVVKIHSDAFQQEASSAGARYPEVNKAIKDAIEVGALVVNYFGHGGEDGLAKERIFDVTDAKNINNLCKFNCFITVTCEYTKFDDPNRETAGEFVYWNKNGGAIGLITTTRQIFVTVGVAFNQILDDYILAYNSNEYPSIAEALRQTKADNSIAGVTQKRLVFFIGDPAMKLSIPQQDIRLTHVNETPITQPIDTLKALSYNKLAGEVVDENGGLLSNYNGTLTATIYDKPINRQTLANDGTTQAGQQIKLDFTTLGEIVFKGQATIQNGRFEFDFIVPRDIGIPVGNGKISFYAKRDNQLTDQAGANFDVKIGGINPNAPEDNVGPVINPFMNDENFISGGITNESPNLLIKLQDDNGINTASGIGHDITAILDGDQTNPIILNDYYQADIDDYTNGTVTYPFRDLEQGIHTLTIKAWDVYNNSSTSEIQFTVYNSDEQLVITNVLNYPNPFISYTEFWFSHNSAETLDITIQIFTVSGKLVRTLNGQTSGGSKNVSSTSKDIVWDGRDDFGDKIGKGVYVYKLKVKSPTLNKQVEKTEKIVIL